MGTGKHRTPTSQRRRMAAMAVAGAVPLALVLGGTANAELTRPTLVAQPDQSQPDQPQLDQLQPRTDQADTDQAESDRPESDEPVQWPAADVPNVRPYQGFQIPDGTLSSLQWARPMPERRYLAPVDALHAPGPVAPVPPIAPPPGKLRFGDVQVDAPGWLFREHAIQINDCAAMVEADMATFLDSIGMERSRSDRIAGETLGAAMVGAVTGAAVASPFALTGAAVGGTIGLAIGLPFVPIGLAAGPIGAAYGAALMIVPLAAIGAGLGAVVGAVNSISAPPQTLRDAPRPPHDDNDDDGRIPEPERDTAST